jgi:hypothetical protein
MLAFASFFIGTIAKGLSFSLEPLPTSATNGTEKGFDAGKLIWGRKRHALVDTQGNLMEVHVTAASTSDLARPTQASLCPSQATVGRQSLWGNPDSMGR